MKIKFVQNFINIIIGKKRLSINFVDIQKKYKIQIKKLSKKLKKGQKIKVAFLHMYATDIQNLCIFEKMLESDIFDPYFIVNPDVSRSKENFDFVYNKAKKELINTYGKDRVLDGYDYRTNKFIDFTKNFDIATTNNPYDGMAHKYYKIKYWARKKVPLFYISYFYMGRCFVSIQNLCSDEYSCFWKFFAENDNVLNMAKKYQKIKGQNVVVAGCPKLDNLAKIKTIEKKRKMIIVAPHHTIDDDEKSVGGFLQYSDELLKIVKKYENVDFVFRPHPLLFENLRTKYWGKEKSEKYLEDLLANENVKYSTEGDYQTLFVNSDALIHDCGSFSAEYLCIGKPCAYFYKKGINPEKIWTDFGKGCINQHYLIHNSEELNSFIKNIVIDGQDYKKQDRELFANKYIKVNFPNSADVIYKNLISSFSEEECEERIS